MALLLLLIAAGGAVVGALYFLSGAVLVAIGPRFGLGKNWVLYGSWIVALPLVVLIGASAAATGVIHVGPTPSPPSNSSTQPANLQLTFSDPYAGVSPTGPSGCWREDRGGPVAVVGSHNVNLLSDWRWGPRNDKYVRIQVFVKPSDHDGTDLIVYLADRSVMSVAYYEDSLGGQVARTISADGTDGQITFSALAHRPDKDFDPTTWPDTISGTLSWSCAGPEE